LGQCNSYAHAYSVFDDLEANHLIRPNDLWFAYYFNVSVSNISNGPDFALLDELGVDENVYGQCKNDFIKSYGCSAGNFWTTVGRKIK
jgi:hypothetical protein